MTPNGSELSLCVSFDKHAALRNAWPQRVRGQLLLDRTVVYWHAVQLYLSVGRCIRTNAMLAGALFENEASSAQQTLCRTPCLLQVHP